MPANTSAVSSNERLRDAQGRFISNAVGPEGFSGADLHARWRNNEEIPRPVLTYSDYCRLGVWQRDAYIGATSRLKTAFLPSVAPTMTAWQYFHAPLSVRNAYKESRLFDHESAWFIPMTEFPKITYFQFKYLHPRLAQLYQELRQEDSSFKPAPPDYTPNHHKARLSLQERSCLLVIMRALRREWASVGAVRTDLLPLLQEITNYDVDRANRFMRKTLGLALGAGNAIKQCEDCASFTLLREATVTNRDELVCARCLATGYRYSDVTDQYIHPDDWDDSTHEDYSDDDIDDGDYDTSCIKSYSRDVLHYFPAFKKLPGEKTSEYLGVELEIEGRSAATPVNAILERAKFGILKDDGSLDSGFEVVTVPATFAYHTSPQSPWREVCEKAASCGGRSFKKNSTGVHIHVSRESISSLSLGKAIVFVNAESNAAFMRAIAQRNLAAHQYCKTNSAKKIYHIRNEGNRYEAINLTKGATIEFRIFKGTLKYESIMRYIEFVHGLLQFVQTASPKELTFECFIAFIKKQGRKSYPQLNSWLREKCYILAKANPNKAKAADVTEL